MAHDASVNADLYKDERALSKSHRRDLDRSACSRTGHTIIEDVEQQRRKAAMGQLNARFAVQKFHTGDTLIKGRQVRVVGRKGRGVPKVPSFLQIPW